MKRRENKNNSMRKVSDHVNHIFIRLHRINECGRQKKSNQNLSSTQTLNSSGAFIVTSTSFFTRYRFGFKIYNINLMLFSPIFYCICFGSVANKRISFYFFSSIDFKSMLFPLVCSFNLIFRIS